MVISFNWQRPLQCKQSDSRPGTGWKGHFKIKFPKFKHGQAVAKVSSKASFGVENDAEETFYTNYLFFKRASDKKHPILIIHLKHINIVKYLVNHKTSTSDHVFAEYVDVLMTSLLTLAQPAVHRLASLMTRPLLLHCVISMTLQIGSGHPTTPSRFRVARP